MPSGTMAFDLQDILKEVKGLTCLFLADKMLTLIKKNDTHIYNSNQTKIAYKQKPRPFNLKIVYCTSQIHKQKHVIYAGLIFIWLGPAKKLRELTPKQNVITVSLVSIIASMLNLLSQKITKFFMGMKIHSTGTIKNDVINVISQILENLIGQDPDRYIKEEFLVHKQNHLI